MRTAVISTCLLAIAITAAHGQEQERKLLDRILKPDMSLQNSLQEKQFAGGGSVTVKQARTKSFLFFKKRVPEKEFVTNNFRAKEFAGTRSSPYQEARANITTKRRIPKADVPYSTAAFSAVRDAPEARKAVPVSEFTGSDRAFLVRGKRQKILDQQNRAMTIDQVRELLNKNK